MSVLTQNPFAPKPDPKGPLQTSGINSGAFGSVATQQTPAPNPNPTVFNASRLQGINPFATLGISNPQSNLSGNPMPTNTSGGAPSSVQNFLDTFRYQNPTQNSPQWMFNDIASKYGTNAAWSWALNNAWGDLGGWKEGSLPMLMDQAGISNEDRNRILNTYSGASKSNYWDGYKHDMTAMGNPFNPTSPYSGYRTQMETLHPSNITTNIGTTPTTNNNNTTTNPVVNNTAQVTNTPQYTQSATNFQGYNPYANNNLAGNPYSTAGVKPVAGDTSISQTPVTGVS